MSWEASVSGARAYIANYSRGECLVVYGREEDRLFASQIVGDPREVGELMEMYWKQYEIVGYFDKDHIDEMVGDAEFVRNHPA